MNTWKVRGLSLVLTGSLLVTGLGMTALAADGKKPTEKNETVFVVAGADGTAKEVIVSDWLRNGEGADILQDESDLTEIQVVKGDAEQTGSGANLTWKTGGEDVYYQGTSTKQLPVGVEIAYELDGKRITPEELAGKSGKLKIVITYVNHTKKTVTVDGEEETMAAPFLMATGLLVDSGCVKNVEVDHGTVETDGDRTMILGYGLPGLGDSLKLEALADGDKEAPELPETVEITANVTDFDLEMAVTVASCGLLDRLDLTGTETRQELEEALTALEDATEELMDGTEELLEGTGKLKDGTGALLDGAVQLDDGAGELQSGGSTLQTGAGTLDQGAGELQAGVASLNGGIAQIQQALAALDAQSGTLTNGSAAVKQALLQIQSGLQGVGASTDALETLVGGSGQIQQGITALTQSIYQLQQGVSYDGYAQTMKDNGVDLAALQAGNSAAMAEIDNMIAALDAQISALGGTTSGTAGHTAPAAPAVPETGSDTETAVMPETSGTEREPAAEEAPEVQTVLPAEPAQTENVEAACTGFMDAEPQVRMLDDGTDPLTQLVNMKKQLLTIKTLLAGNNGAIAGSKAYLDAVNYNLAQLLSGARTLETAYGNMHSGILTLAGTLSGLAENMETLSAGINLLVTEYTALDGGTRAYTGAVGEILAGQRKLSGGAAQLVQGTGTLKAGTEQLYTGAGTLVSGLNTLRQGTSSLKDGAQELDDGAGALNEGAEKLRDGMKEYREDGIEKLLDLYWDNVPKLIARLEALKEVGTEYDSFGGAAEGTECSVRYVIRTEG